MVQKSLQFADTVFAFLPGVTETQSRAIVAANPAIFKPSFDKTALRLAAAFDPAAAIVIPPGISATPKKSCAGRSNHTTISH